MYNESENSGEKRVCYNRNLLLYLNMQWLYGWWMLFVCEIWKHELALQFTVF